ncbi:YggT family protein [Marinomonas ostreistagni]|uniref:YggT family protein n=1 Tax=Marinomonas ostreistagni TaxID=359209 RepID=A0ABS0Z9T2_9GAMM|nr:YggT family protein [Marinomonas ostreistagni]MBJ7550406.1 YggT family protein [Marinomonas ostreistagni]
MMSDPLILVVKTLGNLYLFIVLLRLVLQLSRADFYNPISQGVVKATSPLLKPLRKIIPSIGRIDTSSVVLALAVQAVILMIVMAIVGYQLTPTHYVIYTLAGVAYHLLDLYFWAMLISVILSWVAPGSGHPGALLVGQVCEPLYRVCHRFIPSLGGFDLSPIFIFLAISVLKQFVAPFVI